MLSEAIDWIVKMIEEVERKVVGDWVMVRGSEGLKLMGVFGRVFRRGITWAISTIIDVINKTKLATSKTTEILEFFNLLNKLIKPIKLINLNTIKTYEV